MKAISELAKAKGVVTMIDNTFASPINQTPVDFGIDIVIHSATKYMGGAFRYFSRSSRCF